MSAKKSLLFFRDFQKFQGGHLKVWDYFNHVTKSSSYTPTIYFPSTCKFDLSNPWFTHGMHNAISIDQIESADAFFVAGNDWSHLPQNIHPHKPIINLIQGFSHFNDDDEKHRFLSRKAIRICVSKEVKYALDKVSHVNGPVFVVPNGLNLREMPPPYFIETKEIDILIVGIKKPRMASDLFDKIINKYNTAKVECIDRLMPRVDFLKKLRSSIITICLPKIEEGFYLPALEAMYYESIVICPDCIGNKSFCIHGVTCLIPTKYTLEYILDSLTIAYNYLENDKKHILGLAKDKVLENSAMEEKLFLSILDRAYTIWNSYEWK